MSKIEANIQPKTEIVICEDGSKTLYRKDLDEHYHSSFGAYSESMHIFIDAGFEYLSRKKSNLNVLEVGFGTGLNAFLTYFASEKSNIKVQYVGVEKYKLSFDLLQFMDYSSLVYEMNSEQLFRQIHKANWGENKSISDLFSLYKVESGIEDLNLEVNNFDLVYFDAFAPDVQPELWSVEVFGKLYEAMKKDGVLVTYSCKGDVKRALKSVGFQIEKLPGPKGKREFLRAIKK